MRFQDLPDCLPDNNKRNVNGRVLYKTAKNVTFSNQWQIVKSASKWMKILANDSW